jgi:hypothetical protein
VPNAAAAIDTSRFWKDAQDLWLEVFILFNFLCLTGDILLAHSENAFRNPWEYLPVAFSPVAALLLGAGLFARIRFSNVRLWSGLGSLVGWLSLAIGIAGVIFHLDSSFFYERTLRSLTYAAPFAAPLSYAGLGCLLLMNRKVSCRTRDWAMWVLFFAMAGFAGNLALSLTDHATNGFFHWTEWIPVWSSALAVGFFAVYFLQTPEPIYDGSCIAVLFLQVLVGVAGFALHGFADLHGPSASLFHNVVGGAPPFAPLLLPNLAILGLLGILARRTQHQVA